MQTNLDLIKNEIDNEVAILMKINLKEGETSYLTLFIIGEDDDNFDTFHKELTNILNDLFEGGDYSVSNIDEGTILFTNGQDTYVLSNYDLGTVFCK